MEKMCPGFGRLLLLAMNRMDANDQEDVAAHVSSCENCAQDFELAQKLFQNAIEEKASSLVTSDLNYDDFDRLADDYFLNQLDDKELAGFYNRLISSPQALRLFCKKADALCGEPSASEIELIDAIHARGFESRVQKEIARHTIKPVPVLSQVQTAIRIFIESFRAPALKWAAVATMVLISGIWLWRDSMNSQLDGPLAVYLGQAAKLTSNDLVPSGKTFEVLPEVNYRGPRDQLPAETGLGRLLNEAVQSDPDNAFLRNKLGIYLYFEGDIDGAEEQLLKATELEESNANYHSDLAMVLAKKDEYDRAEASLARALKLRPNAPLVLYNQALLLQKSGRKEEAADAWQKFVENGEGHVEENLIILAKLRIKNLTTR